MVFFLQVLNTKSEHFKATLYLLANFIFSHLHRISYHSLWHMADADHDIGHKTTWHTLFDLVNLVLSSNCRHFCLILGQIHLPPSVKFVIKTFLFFTGLSVRGTGELGLDLLRLLNSKKQSSKKILHSK